MKKTDQISDSRKNIKKLYALRGVGFIFFSIILFLMINLAVNYAYKLFVYIQHILKGLLGGSLPAPSWAFRWTYFISSPIRTPFIIAAAIFFSILWGWKVVKKVERLWSSIVTDYRPDEIDGTSRWASNKELAEILTPVDKSRLDICEKSGLILAEDAEKYYIDTSNTNTLVIGKTRSGKGQGFVLPSIRQAALSKEKASLVVVDPKGENLENTYALLQEMGYRIWVINYRDPLVGMGYNNLYAIIREYKKQMEISEADQDFSKCAELVNELSFMHTMNNKSDPVWPESAQALLSAMIFYLLEVGCKNGEIDKLNMYTVKTFFLDKGTKEVQTASGKTLTELDLLMQSLPLESQARQFYATSRFAEGEMRSSINSTLSSNLSPYSDTGLAKMSGRTDIDFTGLSTDIPTALFLIVPDDKKSRHKLVAFTIKQLYTELVDLAMDLPRQKLSRRVFIIADEIAQMPPFPNLDEMLSVSLGRNILWSLYIQSFAQLNKVYGDNEARIIRDAMTNFVYILSSDPATNKEFSEMLGSGTKQFMTTSGEHGSLLEASQTQSHVKGRPLLLPDELNRLKEWEIIIKIDRHYPIRTRRTPFYKLGLPVVRVKDMGFGLKFDGSSLLMPYDAKSESSNASNFSNEDDHTSAERNISESAIENATADAFLIMRVMNLAPSFEKSLNAFDFKTAKDILGELREFGSLTIEDYKKMILFIKNEETDVLG